MSFPHRRDFLFLSSAMAAACAACAPVGTGAPPTPAIVVPRTAASRLVAGVERIDLSDATNGLALENDVPTVSLVDGKIEHDGVVVADVSAVVQRRLLTRVEGLFDSLKAAREAWKIANPGRQFHGAVLLAFDAKAPALQVKSILQTAAFAGYPHARFAVRGAGAVTRLNVDAIVPGPPGSSAFPEPGARLLVVVRPERYVLVWRKDGATVSTSEVVAPAELAARVQKEWALHAVHREASDQAFDQAVLYVGDDVDHARIVAAVDGIHATTRELATGGATKRVPAINVNLGMATEIGGAGDPLSARGREPATIREIVLRGAGGFRACYEKGVARKKSLAGAVRVRFVIQPSGKVSDVTDEGSALPDAEVVKCIMRKFGELTFSPSAGGPETVVYPLVFRRDASAPSEEAGDGGVGIGRP
ncbi:MAG: AgmX/PglI C-terminal domain-containing protein [Labilithrix sp.]|nr:AgmX/PglI C-terminal domain-containing protein [Labilithrix sp.]